MEYKKIGETYYVRMDRGDEIISNILEICRKVCLCWFAVLVFLVDGVLKFQTLVDYFGSYALVEISLLLLVILPTIAVYKLTKET